MFQKYCVVFQKHCVVFPKHCFVFQELFVVFADMGHRKYDTTLCTIKQAKVVLVRSLKEINQKLPSKDVFEGCYILLMSSVYHTHICNLI